MNYMMSEQLVEEIKKATKAIICVQLEIAKTNYKLDQILLKLEGDKTNDQRGVKADN